MESKFVLSQIKTSWTHLYSEKRRNRRCKRNHKAAPEVAFSTESWRRPQSNSRLDRDDRRHRGPASQLSEDTSTSDFSTSPCICFINRVPSPRSSVTVPVIAMWIKDWQCSIISSCVLCDLTIVWTWFIYILKGCLHVHYIMLVCLINCYLK